MAGVPFHSVDGYLRKIMSAGHKRPPGRFGNPGRIDCEPSVICRIGYKLRHETSSQLLEYAAAPTKAFDFFQRHRRADNRMRSTGFD
jgi:hypothetical protein